MTWRSLLLAGVLVAGLAILLVGEPFRGHEALALALVIGGIAIAERPGRRRRGAQGLSRRSSFRDNRFPLVPDER